MYIFYHINNTRTEVHNFQNFQNYSSGEKIYFPATELLEQLNIELRKPMAFSQKKKRTIFSSVIQCKLDTVVLPEDQFLD